MVCGRGERRTGCQWEDRGERTTAGSLYRTVGDSMLNGMGRRVDGSWRGAFGTESTSQRGMILRRAVGIGSMGRHIRIIEVVVNWKYEDNLTSRTDE